MPPIFVLITPAQYREDRLELTGETYHHLARVRRVRVGASLRAALPDGRVLAAEVTAITPDILHARVTGEDTSVSAAVCRITLYQGVLKGEKMDVLVQKACELGVTTLVPLLTRASVPRWTPAQACERAQRWQRIADAAAEQCERGLPMRVETPVTVAAAIPTSTAFTLLLHERKGESLHTLATRHPQADALSLFIGPEGGWSADEADTILSAGAHPIHLGPRILRAETAALAAVTLAQYLWGDLG